MPETIRYIERSTSRIEEERIYGGALIEFLYSSNRLIHLFALPLLKFVSAAPFFSRFYGWLQNLPSSRRKILPFITKYQIDPTEFLVPVETFRSFNDFFIRQLKGKCRPIYPGEKSAVIPADGRYRFFPDLSKVEGFYVKGKFFSLSALLQDEILVDRYQQGSMLFGRLCPTDYHRFHFPCDCTPAEPRLINGALYSVNPIALRKNISILSENKRMITELDTSQFGKVLFIEVGATNVGSIHQTFKPGKRYAKGEEKGYFSFGGSAVLLLFEPNRIHFAEDLLISNPELLEIRCLMGQKLGEG